MFPTPKEEPIPSIIEQNRDVESFVIQSKAGRTPFFKDPFEPLQFVHFADVHYEAEHWDRIVEYINHYSGSISFGLHTGDYCKSCQLYYTDFYNQCKPCVRPILNCVGNHDTYATREILTSPKSVTHGLLFNRTENWDVVFMPGEFSMTYYKDFEASNIRLVVYDCYYDVEEQVAWMREVLEEARKKGYHVITASHEETHPLVKRESVTFQTVERFEDIAKNTQTPPFDQLIADFKEADGIHVCHLSGHDHHDSFGYTARGILNVIVECATSWRGWCDGDRVRGTRTYDCFNVVTVDTNLHLLKLVRVGNNCDHFLRSKRVLCYDYKNQQVIYND